MPTERAILSALEQRRADYEDPDFPAVAGDGMRWRRPREVFGPGAQLFPPGDAPVLALPAARRQRCDVGLLSALSILAARPAMVRDIFVSTRGSARGLYTLQFFSCDEWVQVMLDDRLLCDAASGAPVYAACPGPNAEF